MGTAINKATLLSDETAAKLRPAGSMPADPVVDLARLSLVVNATKFEIISYIGTGTSGPDFPNSITFPFEPKIIGIFSSRGNIKLDDTYGNNYSGYFGETSVPTGKYEQGCCFYGRTQYGGEIYTKISNDRKTISWYMNGNGDSIRTSYQLNSSGDKYVAFGLG